MRRLWASHLKIHRPVLEGATAFMAREILGISVQTLFRDAERGLADLGCSAVPDSWRLRVASLDADPRYSSPAQLMLIVDVEVED